MPYGRARPAVGMGRNIFQSDVPEAMMKVVGKVVHADMKHQDAYELYQTLKNESEKS